MATTKASGDFSLTNPNIYTYQWPEAGNTESPLLVSGHCFVCEAEYESIKMFCDSCKEVLMFLKDIKGRVQQGEVKKFLKELDV